MKNTGERQIGKTFQHIAPNHLKRYEFAAKRVSGYVLDAACGVGYGANVLAEKSDAVRAIDISSEAIGFAKTYYGHNKVIYESISIHDFLIRSIKFNWIVSFETIEHIDDAETALKLMSGVSNNLILSVPNQNVLPFSKKTHPFHVRHYTPEQLEKMLTECGWHISGWWTQYDKWVGDVVEGKDGQFLIVEAHHGNNT